MSHDVLYKIQQELQYTQTEVSSLVDENRLLKLRALELKAQVELEQGRRHEIEVNVSKVLNSPGSAKDQMEMWAKQVSVLKEITNLQSSLIDKEFIIKQNDVIKDLRGVLELASPEPSEFDEQDESVCESEPNAKFVTVDEATCSPTSERTEIVDKPCPPPKFKKGNTYVLYNSRASQPAATSVSLADLHTQDRERVKRCVDVLHRLKSLPEHVDTILIGDSNMHKIKGRQLDPVDRSTWVLSIGGLCIPALVHALQQQSKPYNNIKKVGVSVGTNDYLHRTQHVVSERGRYLKALKEVSGKLFPNASINFVLPFTGGKTPKSHIDRLYSDINSHIPDCVILRPPDMKSKLSDGVHLNQGGISRLVSFLQERLIARRPAVFSRESGRRSSASTYAGSVNPGSMERQRRESPPVIWNSPLRSQQGSSPPDSGLSPHRQQIDQSLVAEVTAGVIHELMSRNLLYNVY